jgi:lysophospholipase L1-like esterase
VTAATTPLGLGKRLLFAAVLALAGGVAAVAVGEVLLRVAWRPASVFRALPPGLRATFHAPHAHGVETPAVYAVNAMGVRGREWSGPRAAQYRVLCLGGSTTQNLLTQERHLWTTLLERRLGRLPDGRQAWVGNAGRSGLGTAEHVLQMRHLPDVYDPDHLVLLAGINDLSRRLAQADDYEPFAADRPDEQFHLTERAFGVFPGSLPQGRTGDSWLQRTRVWRLLRLAKYQLVNRGQAEDREGDNLAAWRARRAAGRRSAALPPLEPALAEYRRNLRLIVAMARARGTPIVLLTQPVLWRAGLAEEEKALLWLGGAGDFRRVAGAIYYEPEALAAGMDAYNRVLLEVCAETAADCVDLAARIPKTPEFFYDDCHFTDSAQPMVAEAVAEVIQHRLVPAPAGGPGPSSPY